MTRYAADAGSDEHVRSRATIILPLPIVVGRGLAPSRSDYYDELVPVEIPRPPDEVCDAGKKPRE